MAELNRWDRRNFVTCRPSKSLPTEETVMGRAAPLSSSLGVCPSLTPFSRMRVGWSIRRQPDAVNVDVDSELTIRRDREVLSSIPYVKPVSYKQAGARHPRYRRQLYFIFK
jgi:hypothetical protein